MNPLEPRGLELPQGCKDLLDAVGLGESMPRQVTTFTDGLADLDAHIIALQQSQAAVRWLAIAWHGQSDFVYLILTAQTSLCALFDCPHDNGGHEQAIRDVFLESGIKPFSEKVRGENSVTSLRYQLPADVQAAAELMREVLLRGCVVPERAILVFRRYENSAGT